MRDKLKTWLPILSIVGGFALVYGGWKLPIPMLVNLGLLLIGIGIIIFGIDAIKKRESSYSGGEESITYQYSFRGFSAVMDGILLVFLGLAAFIAGVIALAGWQEKVLAYFGEHPGILLIIGGLMLGAYAITQISGTQESKLSVLSFLGSLPGRVFGLLLLLAGLAMVLFGGFELLSPDGFDRFFENLKPVF
jgi:hypothetical protein